MSSTQTPAPSLIGGEGAGTMPARPTGTATAATPATLPSPRVAGSPLIVITAYGDPEGQGRISYSKHGRGYYTNDARLKPWRKAVRDAAMAELGTHQHVPPTGEKGAAGPCMVCRIPKKNHGLLSGALRTEFIVSLPKLKSAPKTRILDPVTRSSGDWDHHGRSIGDALTQASVMCDDSQIIDGRVAKYYVGHPMALDRPGAVIRIWRIAPGTAN